MYNFDKFIELRNKLRNDMNSDHLLINEKTKMTSIPDDLYDTLKKAKIELDKRNRLRRRLKPIGYGALGAAGTLALYNAGKDKSERDY